MQAWLPARLAGERIALVAGAAAVLTFLAPFNSGAMPLAARFLYWGGMILFGLTLSVFASHMLDRRLPSLHAAMQGLLLSVLISVPLAIAAFLVARIPMLAAPSADPTTTLVSVWVVAAAMTAVGLLSRRAGTKRGGPDGGPSLPPFRRRLPVHLRQAELWAVSAEDHYLRVSTSAGEALISGRFTDAVAELGQLTGAQVHRSWWIAEAGLAQQRACGLRQKRLMLKDGREAPVSRSRRPAVRRLGWL